MTGTNPRRRAVADALLLPWVVVAPDGVHWLGHAATEADAWSVALGWPDAAEIAEHKRLGWYAAEATVKWQRPGGVPGAPEIGKRSTSAATASGHEIPDGTAVAQAAASLPVANGGDARVASAGRPDGVRGYVRPQECAASGAGHSDGPHGPHGEVQCAYCGQSPSACVPEAGPNDTERLEWLTRHVSGKALREAGVSWPAWSLDNARAAIDAARNAGVPASAEPIPERVYWAPLADNFYSAEGKGMGLEFHRKWRPRRAEFPQGESFGWGRGSAHNPFKDPPRTPGVPASGTETMRAEYRREDLGDGVRGRCPNCLDTGYIAGDTDQPCGCEAGRSAKSEVDWGAVDDELLQILRRADHVHSSVMVSELRALLRKVSGQ